MIQPLFNSIDDEWITMVGKYVLNMGGVEAATRMLVAISEQSDTTPIINADLPSRIGYLRRRFPREPQSRHSSAMKTFDIASKQVGFRNIVAHSPVIVADHADGSRVVHGILNITPNDPNQSGEMVGLAELRVRVDESAALAKSLMEMHEAFREGLA